MSGAIPVLEARELTVGYPSGSALWRRGGSELLAVNQVSLAIQAGETLGLVGESGCGKSSLGRALMRLQPASSGQVLLHGNDITRLGQSRLRHHRRDMQMIWQDPSAALSPRRSIGQSMREPLDFHRIGSPVQRRQVVSDLLERVGLDDSALDRFPHEFSGGQRQRISIARALTLQPSLLVADEPVSSLDVSVQSQILNLLRELGQEMGLAMLFISHDLAVVQHVSDRVAVMYLGRLVEVTDRERLFNQPLHPYTQALLLASPIPQPRRRPPHAPLRGELPSLARPPAGCPFHSRCPKVMPRCRNERPEMVDYGPPGRPHLAACHLNEPEEASDAPSAPDHDPTG